MKYRYRAVERFWTSFYRLTYEDAVDDLLLNKAR
jgi:hypothetical protein